MGLLSIRDDVLVLHSMKWPDEVRSPDKFAPDAVDLDEDEITRAMELMDSMTTGDLSDCRDHDRDALEEVVEAKREGEELPEPARPARRTRAPVVPPLRHVRQPPRRYRVLRADRVRKRSVMSGRGRMGHPASRKEKRRKRFRCQSFAHRAIASFNTQRYRR
ncbi:hypothetical protein ACFCW6_01895 [Streptomyces sp. NPDC056333]|uniref:hypothetical protein n=1 Tax=Streptomyces sp. NPDC056333 TaxID=3345786 RepID=UPI0035E15BB9